MSDAFSRLRFIAAQPRIDAIEDALMIVLDGEEYACGLTALSRVMRRLLAKCSPEVKDQLLDAMRKVITMSEPTP